MENIVTMILSGGKGERLYPLTKNIAKPAVSFGGIYKIIDFTLSNCLNSGIRKIYLLTQYKSVSLTNHLHRGWMIFNHELGEYIITIPPQQKIYNRWYQGTADAIYQNLDVLEQERPENVLILSGDHIYKMDYGKMLKFHKEKNAHLTVAVIDVSIEEAKRFGVLSINKNWKITDFQEKPENPVAMPDDPGKSLISMGVYIFNTEKLVRNLIRNYKKETSHDFGKDIIPHMINKDRVYAYPFEDENYKPPVYWRDIGDIDSYWEANMDLTEIDPHFNLYDKRWPIRTYFPQEPPVKTVFSAGSRRSHVYDSVASPGTIISGGTIKRCVLGPNVRINSFSYSEETIFLEGSSIGRNSKIKKAIVDEGVNIPENTIIGYNVEEDKKRFKFSEKGVVLITDTTL